MKYFPSIHLELKMSNLSSLYVFFIFYKLVNCDVQSKLFMVTDTDGEFEIKKLFDQIFFLIIKVLLCERKQTIIITTACTFHIPFVFLVLKAICMLYHFNKNKSHDILQLHIFWNYFFQQLPATIMTLMKHQKLQRKILL